MTKITKAEFDALPESLKAKFVADGDGYALQEEDVEGLKKSKADILKEKKELQDKFDELAKFKADADAKKTQEEQELLAKKGEFEELLKQKEKAFRDQLKAATEAQEKTEANFKRERWANYLAAENNIDLARIDAIRNLDRLFERVKLTAGDNGSFFELADGVGGADELKSEIAKITQNGGAFLAKAQQQTGGGATGSGNNAGNGNTITRAQYDANPFQYGTQLAKGELSVVD